MVDTDRSSTVAHEDSADFNSCEFETRSVEELEEEIAELCAHIDAATYRLLRAIGELDRREAWAVGFRSTAHWLSWKVGIDLVTAREKVRVAWALDGLPKISDAFRQGRMSHSTVRAMTRIGTAENESHLLYIVGNGTATHVERLVRSYMRASRGEDVEGARRQRQERSLEMYTDDDGMVVIRGRLPQEVAALLEKALEAAMDALKEEPKREERREIAPSDGGPGSNAPAEASGGQKPHGGNGSSDCREMTRSRDASAEASRQDGPGPTDDLGESCTTSVIAVEVGVPWLRIATDPSGASAEVWPRESMAQRRLDALGLLAGATLGRGLGQTERGEPYQGKYHHWAIHEGGVRVKGRAPRDLVFHRPDGTVLFPCSVRVPIDGQAGETLKEAYRRHRLRITAKTVDSFWDGEPMDYHMAVDALLTYDDDPIDEK